MNFLTNPFNTSSRSFTRQISDEKNHFWDLTYRFEHESLKQLFFQEKNMKKISLGTIGAVALLLGSNAPALQAREFADIFCECGIGAMIAPKNAAVAAITNVTWDLGTTAISSDITSPDTCVGGKEKVASMIYHSYEELEKDIAMGEGSYLNTLLDLSGKSSAKKAELSSEIRQDFSKLVSKAEYASMDKMSKAEQLFNIFYKNVEA